MNPRSSPQWRSNPVSEQRRTPAGSASSSEPRFPVESLPPEIADMVRAVAEAEKVTVPQAAIATLIAVSDTTGWDTVHLAGAPDLELPPLEIGFLVPDPADRPAVLRAYRTLMQAMPSEARRRAVSGRLAAEIAAGTVEIVPRGDPVAIIAARYEKRDAYLVAAGPGQVLSALARLAPVAEATVYLDQGGETVMSATGAALEVMPDLMETAAPFVAVWVVPKSVHAARLGKALGDSIPADGSRDLIVLAADDSKHAAYPEILVEAIERVDPAAAAHIRGAEGDLVLSHMSVRARALADQAGAAGAAGLGILAAMAEAGGGTPAYQVPPPLIQEVTDRFPRLAAAGQLQLCRHLSPAAPEPAFWSAWDPGRLRCARCLATAPDIAGTDEDHRCDYCNRSAETIHPETVLLPAVVADLPGMVAARGPVMAMFGLCPRCHAEAFPIGGPQ